METSCQQWKQWNQVNNGNIRSVCENCSELTIKTPRIFFFFIFRSKLVPRDPGENKITILGTTFYEIVNVAYLNIVLVLDSVFRSNNTSTTSFWGIF